MSNDTRSKPHVRITSHHRLLDLKLDEVWKYRDLIVLYAHRSITATYKQTILGPGWLILNPLLTSVIYMVVFGNIAKLSTDGVPQLLFYLMSNAAWAFFSAVITQSADTFVANAHLFGKVYFPRLTIPLANALVALLQFAIQLALGLAIGVYYMATSDFAFTFAHWPLIPLVLLLELICGLGFGIIASSLTTRYRDLRTLVGFGVRLWMYITPVVYPMSQFTGGIIEQAISFNPMTAPMECMRWCLWGTCQIGPSSIVYSVIVSVVVLLVGIILFNKVERTFLDTV